MSPRETLRNMVKNFKIKKKIVIIFIDYNIENYQEISQNKNMNLNPFKNSSEKNKEISSPLTPMSVKLPKSKTFTDVQIKINDSPLKEELFGYDFDLMKSYTNYFPEGNFESLHPNLTKKNTYMRKSTRWKSKNKSSFCQEIK